MLVTDLGGSTESCVAPDGLGWKEKSSLIWVDYGAFTLSCMCRRYEQLSLNAVSAVPAKSKQDCGH